MSEDYSSLNDTLDHKRLVSHYMNLVIKDLIERAEKHDDTKMESDEVEYFDEYTPKLKGCTYGSPEYLEFLEHLKPALDHHYSRYRHHPEHFPNGIKGMDLVDLIEMICDWKASSLRMQNGNILLSIDKNQDRFGYGKELHNILVNTVERFED